MVNELHVHLEMESNTYGEDEMDAEILNHGWERRSTRIK